jgi:hypothetical protein
VSEGRPGITLTSPPDVTLPPDTRRAYSRTGRAALTAGTLGTVGDDVAGQDGERYVVARDLDRDDADVMHAETVRQARLRRWQAIR